MPDSLVQLYILLPISLIGVWRWLMWVAKRSAAALFRPVTESWPNSKQKPMLSVVTPVYNEDEELFNTAVDSWIAGGADEIIAVIDKTNTRLIVDYSRRYMSRKDIKCKLLVTPKRGKRAALCDGAVKAKGDLIALVDSDTIWSNDVKTAVIPHFINTKVGGVTVRQRIYKPRSLQDVLFDILLWTRYREEVPFMLGIGNVFNTLSGRTAIYRKEALLNDRHDNIHLLRHEFFMGTRGISGDDKRLTHLILEQGWHIGYEPTITVYTPGIDTLQKFMKQRLRWTRNSWRADSRAFAKGWVFKHPALAIHNLDRFIQPFLMLIGPVSFVIFLINGIWGAALILLAWWFISRFIKLFGYFRDHPQRLIFLPMYIIFSYVTALVKIYALATILEHNWATRWHKVRMKSTHMFRRYGTVVFGFFITIVALLAVIDVISDYTKQIGLRVETEQSYYVSEQARLPQTVQDEYTITPIPPEGATFSDNLIAYTVEPGDVLVLLSKEWGISIPDIKRMNSIPDSDEIEVGQVIYRKASN